MDCIHDGPHGRDEVYARALEGEAAEIPVSVSGGADPLWSSDGTETFYRTPGRATFMVARLEFTPRLDVVRRDSLGAVGRRASR